MIPAAIASHLPLVFNLAFLALIVYVIVVLNSTKPIRRRLTVIGVAWVTLIGLGVAGVHDLRTQGREAAQQAVQEASR